MIDGRIVKTGRQVSWPRSWRAAVTSGSPRKSPPPPCDRSMGWPVPDLSRASRRCPPRTWKAEHDPTGRCPDSHRRPPASFSGGRPPTGPRSRRLPAGRRPRRSRVAGRTPPVGDGPLRPSRLPDPQAGRVAVHRRGGRSPPFRSGWPRRPTTRTPSNTPSRSAFGADAAGRAGVRQRPLQAAAVPPRQAARWCEGDEPARRGLQADEPGVRPPGPPGRPCRPTRSSPSTPPSPATAAYVFLPRNVTVDGPIHLLFVTAPAGRPCLHRAPCW